MAFMQLPIQLRNHLPFAEKARKYSSIFLWHRKALVWPDYSPVTNIFVIAQKQWNLWLGFSQQVSKNLSIIKSEHKPAFQKKTTCVFNCFSYSVCWQITQVQVAVWKLVERKYYRVIKRLNWFIVKLQWNEVHVEIKWMNEMYLWSQVCQYFHINYSSCSDN